MNAVIGRLADDPSPGNLVVRWLGRMREERLNQIRQRLLEGMVGFMIPDAEEPDPNFDCGYTQTDIDRCLSIIDAFVQSLHLVQVSDQTAILNSIQNTVEQLNDLNETCDGCLIETDQREDLCELILNAAKNAGLEYTGDVTEQWREW